MNGAGDDRARYISDGPLTAVAGSHNNTRAVSGYTTYNRYNNNIMHYYCDGTERRQVCFFRSGRKYLHNIP